MTALSDHFLRPLTSEVILACEKEAWKQEFLMAHIIKKDTCLFDDVQTLGALANRPEIDLTALQVPDSGSKIPKAKSKEKDLSKTPQFCAQHQGHCDPRGSSPVFLLKSGFSCKGNSRMNVKFVEFQQSMKNGDMSNSSVSTFYGTLGTIELLKPSMFVLENVDSVGSETSEDSNLSKIMDELRCVSSGLYSAHTYHLATSDFLLPQSRTST